MSIPVASSASLLGHVQVLERGGVSKGDGHERTTAHHPVIPVKELELLGEELDMASAVRRQHEDKEKVLPPPFSVERRRCGGAKQQLSQGLHEYKHTEIV